MHNTDIQQERGLGRTAMATHAGARSGEAVTFMHLPAEIRNEIYGLALVHNKPLVLSRFAAKNPKSSLPTRARRGSKFEYKLKSTTVAPTSKRKSPVKEAITVALLMTSKTINLEASGIFIRENTFEFKTTAAMYDFCVALGAKAKSLAHMTVKDISTGPAPEQICILSRLEEPQSIDIGAKTRYYPGSLCVLSPSATWNFIKPIIWRLEQPVKPGMSFRPSVPEAAQRKRLEAFEFDVSRHDTMVIGSRGFETVTNDVERQARFKALVVECWHEEVRVTGVRKKRDDGDICGDVADNKKPRVD